MSKQPKVSAEYLAAIDELTDIALAHEIRLKRSSARELLIRLAPTNQDLTIGPMANSSRVHAFRIKSLITLWNFSLDDEIDDARSSEQLDASMLAIRQRIRQERTSTRGARGSTAALLHAFELIDQLAGATAARAIATDLWEHAIGFEYDHITNTHHEHLHTSSYLRFAVLNASPKPFVAIDLSLSNRPLAGRDFMLLRTASDLFAMALKYASDTGTHSRDLREHTGNIIEIRAREDARDDPESLFEEVQGAALDTFEQGLAILREVSSDYETDSFIAATRRLLHLYILHDYSLIERSTQPQD